MSSIDSINSFVKRDGYTLSVLGRGLTCAEADVLANRIKMELDRAMAGFIQYNADEVKLALCLAGRACADSIDLRNIRSGMVELSDMLRSWPAAREHMVVLLDNTEKCLALKTYDLVEAYCLKNPVLRDCFRRLKELDSKRFNIEYDDDDDDDDVF